MEYFIMNKKYYRKRELLEKGFTERMIKKLLPPPRVVNRSLSRGRTKLNKWNKSTVEEVMKSTAFHEALEKSRIRKEISKKGALTRRQNDEKRLNKTEIRHYDRNILGTGLFVTMLLFEV